MILSVGLGSLGAYAGARYKWGGKNFILLLLVIQMLPPVSVALPLFILFDRLKLAFLFSRSRVTPLTVVIPAMVGSDTILWERVYATSLIAIVPVIILSLVLQRYLVRGLTFGAVKG
jgi:multiple sugar transport system permease protein